MSAEKLLQETGYMLFGMSVDMRIHADAREALALRAEKIESLLMSLSDAPDLLAENERLRADNERLRSGDVVLFGVREIVADNERLKARIAELEDGYTIAMRDIDQDNQRFPALAAVLDGVVKSVGEYDAYLAAQLTDGAKS